MAPGARSNFGAPMFEHEVFQKQMYCTEVLVTLLGLFRALIVIRRPGNGDPCPPSLRPWLLRAATRLSKSWYTALTRGIQEPWALGGAKFSFRPNFCATLRKNEQENFAGDGSVSESCPKIFFPEFFQSCPNLPPTSYAYSFNAETLAQF